MYGFVLCEKCYNYSAKSKIFLKNFIKKYWHIGYDMILYNQKGGDRDEQTKKEKAEKQNQKASTTSDNRFNNRLNPNHHWQTLIKSLPRESKISLGFKITYLKKKVKEWFRMSALKFLGIYFIAIGVTKLVIYLIMQRRDEECQ